METNPILNKDYRFGERTVRFIGLGEHTKDYMFRDVHSGAIIFLSREELIKLEDK